MSQCASSCSWNLAHDGADVPKLNSLLSIASTLPINCARPSLLFSASKNAVSAFLNTALDRDRRSCSTHTTTAADSPEMKEPLYLDWTIWCAATLTDPATSNANSPTKNATPATMTSPGAFSGVATEAATRVIHRAIGLRCDRQYTAPMPHTATTETHHATMG